MSKRICKIIGIALCTFALIANLQYALLNYGLKDNSLSQQLYAQDSSSGEDTADDNGGGGTGCYYASIFICGGETKLYMVCNFTGVWGEPYSCKAKDCGDHETERRCVKRV